VTRTSVGLPDRVELEGDRLPDIDPSRSFIISAFGRKRSGKTFFNRRLFNAYPFDKLCIDVNGEADPGGELEKIGAPLPSKWPQPTPGLLGEKRPKYRTLYYRADPGSATYDDDLDRAVGLAMNPQDRHALVWCGEIGEFMPTATKTRPHMRRALMQNRHYKTSLLFDGPRPMNVNPLVLAQSDYVAIYDLPNPHDRQRVAETIGFDPSEFYDECEETFRRGAHWFLLWDAEQHLLYRCPPLPVD